MTGTTNYYYHADGLSSVTEVTDSTGSLVEQYRYDVYGTPSIYDASGVVTNSSTVGNRLLFTARARDPDTGWYDYRYRFYNPSLGRFVQPDPVGIAGNDLNLYRYVENDPVRWIDPDGLDHMNLLPKTQRDWEATNNTWLPGDRYTVNAHGNRGVLFDSNGKLISAEKLAGLIKGDPQYHGQPIELRACYAGVGPVSGGKSFAEQLSDALEGATVSGPPRELGGRLRWNLPSYHYYPDIPYSEWITYPRPNK